MKSRILILPFGVIAILALAHFVSADSRPDWQRLNPAQADATYVNDQGKCAECHPQYVESYSNTRHGKTFRHREGSSGCESCHGPASKHVEQPSRDVIFSFKDPKNTSEKKNEVCLQCHEKGIRMHWRGSSHDMANLSCNKCHYVMEKRSPKNLFIAEDSKKACFQCHKERRAQLQRSSHMPLREGLMDCANCHNPHGGPGPSLLKTASVNETCYQCHQDKRGPLVWEHPPVRENCANCHDPHGSNYESLLKLKPPYLCQSCHAAQFHPSTIYDGSKIVGGAGAVAQQLLGKACLNCHTQVHGSNHPSGPRFQR